MNTHESNIIGLFLANYVIGSGMLGAPSFRMSLLINTPDRSVSGRGIVSQATNPPLNLVSILSGEYHYHCAKSDCYVLMNLVGSQPYYGIPPVGSDLQNSRLHLMLNDDWQAGVANVSYLDPRTGKWTEHEQLPVKLVDNSEISDITLLAQRVKARGAA